MNGKAYDGLLGVIDDSIGLAEDAIKEAEARAVAPIPEPKVTLVKVASGRARQAAAIIIKSGAFTDQSEESLAQVIAQADPVDLVTMLEKLASKAIFPLDADILRAPWMTADDITRASGRHRSPMVARCLDDYLGGKDFGLELIDGIG